MTKDEKRATLKAAGWHREQREHTGEWWLSPTDVNRFDPVRLETAYRKMHEATSTRMPRR